MTTFGHTSPLARMRRLLSGRAPRPSSPAGGLRIVGHRGAARHHPENTIESFQAAIEQGADAIETDLCVTRDGAIVLWHDNEPSDPITLARGAGAEDYDHHADWPHVLSPQREPVYEMTLAEMRERCGYSPRGPGLGGDSRPAIPFAVFDDLLVWAAGEPRLREVFLDVKLRPEDAGAMTLLVQTAARRRPDLEVRLLLPERELWNELGDLPEGMVAVPDFEVPGVLRDVEETGAREVSMGYTKRRTWGDYTRELAEVLDARAAGQLDRVVCWTINRGDRLRFLVEAGVDAILTDDAPALAATRPG